MIIRNSGQLPSPHFQPKPAPISDAVAKNASTGSASTPSLSGVGTLDGLLSLVSDTSEVRDNLVQEIKLKLQTGEYLTHKAAVETADAILNL